MITTTKFTPGPLIARKGIEAGDEHRCGVFAVRDGVEYHVATIENGAPGDICETEFANATLFAAAPELHEACESALMQLRVAVIAHSGGLFNNDNVHEHLGIADLMAALAKARGEHV